VVGTRLLPPQTPVTPVAGVKATVDGELVPVLTLELGQSPVYFEHHILLWKDPQVAIGLKPLKGAFKRMMAGLQVFVTEARGPGRIAFSRDGAGQVVCLPLRAGQGLDVREHQFLAATDNIAYDFERVRGFSNMLFGGSGFFIDHFSCTAGEGALWLHGYGNVLEMTLKPGESVDVEPGAWVYKDRTVTMQAIAQPLKTGFLAGAGTFRLNRFTGPGRVGLQSMYLHMPTEA